VILKVTDIYRFAKHYHPYLPISLRKSLQAKSLLDTARYEPHLLTAMITIAAKDLSGGTEILRICSKYMNELTSDLAGGKRCDVEAVEVLLCWQSGSHRALMRKRLDVARRIYPRGCTWV
jgi:hypothetical protein